MSRTILYLSKKARGPSDEKEQEKSQREGFYTPSTPGTRTSSSNIIHVSHAFRSTEEATQKSTFHGSVAVLSKSRSPAQTYKTFLTNIRKGSRGTEDLSRAQTMPASVMHLSLTLPFKHYSKQQTQT
jgi:hypothetical protein